MIKVRHSVINIIIKILAGIGILALAAAMVAHALMKMGLEMPFDAWFLKYLDTRIGILCAAGLMVVLFLVIYIPELYLRRKAQAVYYRQLLEAEYEDIIRDELQRLDASNYVVEEYDLEFDEL